MLGRIFQAEKCLERKADFCCYWYPSKKQVRLESRVWGVNGRSGAQHPGRARSRRAGQAMLRILVCSERDGRPFRV